MQLSASLEDSGALPQAMAHVARAVALRPSDAAVRFRAALLVPAVQATAGSGAAARAALEARVANLRGTRLETLDMVSMPGTFYVVYLGGRDAALMTTIADAYRSAYPALAGVEVDVTNKAPPPRGARPRVGFVSSYWKRHSVCKLLGGVVRELSATGAFDVTLFSGADAEDDFTAYALGGGARHVRLDRGALLGNRRLAADAGLDVLVFADLGMDTKTVTWAHGRLAPTQVLFWGHPHTSGLPDTVDYFLSADGFEPANDFRATTYAEQPVRFDSLGFFFRRPQDAAYAPPTVAAADAVAARLKVDLGLDAYDALYLVPQSLPKFHPDFDEVLVRLAFSIGRRGGGATREAVVVTYDPKKTLWLNVLRRRLEAAIARYTVDPTPVLARFVFLPMVTGDDFFGLLRLATVLLDPFPFGGGVTSLEAFSVCTPVVTAPRLQTVVALTRGMYKHMRVPDAPVVASAADFAANATALVDDVARRTALEAAICASHDDPATSVFSSRASIDEWATFLRRAAAASRTTRAAAADAS